ncbi:MAG TPA: AmmeMemoRadiSam system protein B [Solibacterales bacterium]|nr:AmmeMemoRadiSam system protein B [Bryobacterales bacterium]
MSYPLPRLRMDLDFMPSPVPDRPGLLIRDPYRYSDTTLIVPPGLTACLQLFDGQSTELDMREMLVRMTGTLDVGDIVKHLVETLDKAGFVHNEVFERMVDARHAEFAAAPTRESVHAGSAYPDEAPELRKLLGAWMEGETADECDSLIGIAAPHVSPEGGWQSYRAAFGALRPEYADRTFIVLGTSHYGEPGRFGLTRKSFVTPYGATRTDLALVNELEANAPGAVAMEDYCHSFEHSIEFQVVFLQHLFGAGVRVVPILCGSFGRSIYQGGRPEDDEAVRRFLEALGEINAREGRKLLWVLGVDMAHMGRRYGDSEAMIAGEGPMAGVAERDQARIASISSGDAAGFWAQVRENHDELKWCGSAPFYSFLKAVPEARGQLRRYEQWNIDEQSVVSFAGMAFRA